MNDASIVLNGIGDEDDNAGNSNCFRRRRGLRFGVDFVSYEILTLERVMVVQNCIRDSM